MPASFYNIHNFIKVMVDSRKLNLAHDYEHYFRLFRNSDYFSDCDYTIKDFRSVCERYLEKGNMEELLGCVVGGQKDDYDWHGMVFDFELLKSGLEDAGFTNVRRYDWRNTDLAKLGIDDFSQAYLPHMDKEHGRLMSLNMEADKPNK